VSESLVGGNKHVALIFSDEGLLRTPPAKLQMDESTCDGSGGFETHTLGFSDRSQPPLFATLSA